MDNEAKLIQKWVDDRFGEGNIFNTQLLLAFLKFAQEELGYRKIEGETTQADLKIKWYKGE